MSINPTELHQLIHHVALYNSHQAYKQLFTSLFPSLFSFSLCLVKSRELAEEVASDVMITIWRNREKLTEIENIKVYALVIAKNMSLNILAKNSRYQLLCIEDVEVELRPDTQTPEQILIDDELRVKLEEATQALPNRCKLVFKLIKQDGLSYKEAAAVLNISTKTVDAHLVTALKKLSSILKIEFNLAGG